MTEVHDYRIDVILTLRSPVLSATTEAAMLGIDSSAWMQERDGARYPLLPGTLIRGNLRHSWKALHRISSDWITRDEIKRWLGDESEETTNEPARGALRMADVWVAEAIAAQDQIRYRIKIDEKTGTVASGALQQVEVPHPAGIPVCYRGHVDFTGDLKIAERISRRIKKGLAFTPALGAFKGIGFGVIEKVCVKKPQKLDIPHHLEDINSNTLALSIELDRPLCLNHLPNHSGNRFESLEYIPGAAIKGTIATRMAQLQGQSRWPELHRHLDKIRFSHAFPALKGESKHRPVPPPLNLYVCKTYGQQNSKRFGIVAPNQDLPDSGHISFQLDWKEHEWKAVNNIFQEDGGNQPEHTLRVRTAIKENTNLADEGRLFSTEVIEAGQHQWLADVYIPPILMEKNNGNGSIRDKVRQQLIDLLGHGLNTIGKLNSSTTHIGISAGNWPITISTDTDESNVICILLMSDTRLFPEQDLQLKACNDGDGLHRLYTNVWHKLSGGLLKLETFYAQQTLYGGEYYRRRFRQTNRPYNPWVITVAGSIFYFSTQQPKECQTLLQRWQQTGLDVLPGLPKAWNHNPLVPENGFGEILVNPKIPLEDLNKGLAS